VNIIGISGKGGSGKSTVADILVKEHGFVCVSLADPMKRFLKTLFEFSDGQLWGTSENRNAEDPRYKLTPRYALQQLGTEYGRRMFEDVWIDYALKMAERIFTAEKDWGYPGYTPEHGFNQGAQHPARGVVIPDIRFANELSRIREAGGRIWYRPDGGLPGAHANHLSEAGLNDFTFDAEIPWASSVNDLPAAVAYLLTQETSKT
jgi:hypothetical protein